jgi:hypothetical protein
MHISRKTLFYTFSILLMSLNGIVYGAERDSSSGKRPRKTLLATESVACAGAGSPMQPESFTSGGGHSAGAGANPLKRGRDAAGSAGLAAGAGAGGSVGAAAAVGPGFGETSPDEAATLLETVIQCCTEGDRLAKYTMAARADVAALLDEPTVSLCNKAVLAIPLMQFATDDAASKAIAAKPHIIALLDNHTVIPNYKAPLAVMLMQFATDTACKAIAAKPHIIALLDDHTVSPNYKALLAKAILNTVELEEPIYLSVVKAVYVSILYSPDVLKPLKRLIVASIIGNALLNAPEKGAAVAWRNKNPLV